MAKVIQVRNVPDHVHAALVRQAAAAGLSLSDAVLRELEMVALRDANEELLGRLALLPHSGVDGAALVRAERDAGQGRAARGARP